MAILKCCINITPLNVSRETWQFRMILICNKVCKKHIANDQAMQKIAIPDTPFAYKSNAN